jgi:hypothetical protein
VSQFGNNLLSNPRGSFYFRGMIYVQRGRMLPSPIAFPLGAGNHSSQPTHCLAWMRPDHHQSNAPDVVQASRRSSAALPRYSISHLSRGKTFCFNESTNDASISIFSNARRLPSPVDPRFRMKERLPEASLTRRPEGGSTVLVSNLHHGSVLVSEGLVAPI